MNTKNSILAMLPGMLLACGSASAPTPAYPNVVQTSCEQLPDGGWFATASLPSYNPEQGATLTMSQCDIHLVCVSDGGCSAAIESACEGEAMNQSCVASPGLTPDPLSGGVSVPCGWRIAMFDTTTSEPVEIGHCIGTTFLSVVQ